MPNLQTEPDHYVKLEEEHVNNKKEGDLGVGLPEFRDEYLGWSNNSFPHAAQNWLKNWFFFSSLHIND